MSDLSEFLESISRHLQTPNQASTGPPPPSIPSAPSACPQEGEEGIQRLQKLLAEVQRELPLPLTPGEGRRAEEPYEEEFWSPPSDPYAAAPLLSSLSPSVSRVRGAVLPTSAAADSGTAALQRWETEQESKRKASKQSFVDSLLFGEIAKRKQRRRERQAAEERALLAEREARLEAVQAQQERRTKHRARTEFLDAMQPTRRRSEREVYRKLVTGTRKQQELLLRRVARNSRVVERAQQRSVRPVSVIPSKRGASFPGLNPRR